MCAVCGYPHLEPRGCVLVKCTAPQHNTLHPNSIASIANLHHLISSHQDMTPFPAELHAALKAQRPEDLAPIVSKKKSTHKVQGPRAVACCRLCRLLLALPCPVNVPGTMAPLLWLPP